MIKQNGGGGGASTLKLGEINFEEDTNGIIRFFSNLENIREDTFTKIDNYFVFTFSYNMHADGQIDYVNDSYIDFIVNEDGIQFIRIGSGINPILLFPCDVNALQSYGGLIHRDGGWIGPRPALLPTPINNEICNAITYYVLQFNQFKKDTDDERFVEIIDIIIQIILVKYIGDSFLKANYTKPKLKVSAGGKTIKRRRRTSKKIKIKRKHTFKRRTSFRRK